MMMRFKAILFIQWQLISKMFAFSLNDIIQLNKLTRNSSIFEAFDIQHARHSSFSIGTVQFNFRDDLLEFLDRLNSTDVVFRLLNFTNIRTPLFQTSLPLFIQASNNDSSKECSTSKITETYLIHSCHKNESDITTTRRDRHVLRSLAIRFPSPGCFSMCAHLGSAIDTSSPIESHQCFNFNVEENEFHHQFRYKPLFIVIMYLLCALVLIVISFGKYLLHRHKLVVQKKVNESSGLKSRSDVSLYRAENKETIARDREPLLNKIQSCGELDTEPVATTKTNNRVLFQVNSLDSIKQQQQQEVPLLAAKEEKIDEENEADHILDDKPWMRTTIDNPTTILGGGGGSQEQLVMPPIKRVNSIGKKTTETSSNLVSTKHLNKSIVVYESNV